MSSAFPNEPSGFIPTTNCPFNQALTPEIFDVYGTAQYISDVTAPLSPSYVLDQKLPVNTNYGGAQLVGNLNRPREVFLGTWWKTNAAYQGLLNNGNKMIFIRAPGSGDNSFLTWYGLQDAPKIIMWDQQGIVNNTHVPGVFGTNYPVDGTGFFLPNINQAAATVSAGSGWHKIEVYLKASTTYTSRDGSVQIWVDGVLTTSHVNIMNISPGGFEEWQINHTWDGGPSFDCAYRDCSREWHHYFDHIYVSVPGSGGTSTPVLQSLSPSSVTLAPGNAQVFSIGMSSVVSASTSISLVSSSPSVASVGAVAIVSPGSASANFQVTGVGSGASTISATLGSVTKQSTVTVAAGGTGGGGGTPTTYTYASQFSGVQGQNQWSYRDTAGKLLVFSSGANKWEGDQLYLSAWSSGFVHGYNGGLKGAVVRWTAPAAGTVSLSGTALLYETPASGTFTVVLNSTTLFSQAMSPSTSYPYSASGLAVVAGDVIDFSINGTSNTTNDNTQLNPVIIFTPTSTGGSGGVTVSSMSPVHGNIGSSVTIVGTGFSATAVNNTITVNGTPATITSSSTTQLTFTVPASATTGLVNVATSAGSVSAGTYTVDNPTTPDTPPASNFGGSAMLLLVMP